MLKPIANHDPAGNRPPRPWPMPRPPRPGLRAEHWSPRTASTPGGYGSASRGGGRPVASPSRSRERSLGSGPQYPPLGARHFITSQGGGSRRGRGGADSSTGARRPPRGVAASRERGRLRGAGGAGTPLCAIERQETELKAGESMFLERRRLLPVAPYRGPSVAPPCALVLPGSWNVGRESEHVQGRQGACAAAGGRARPPGV